MKKPELLAPAGNMEKLEVALAFGADAVYLGGTRYGLRMGADNFTPDQLTAAVEFAHRRKARVYVTLNIFAHNRDFEGLREYVGFLNEIGADGVIVADPGVLQLVRSQAPGLSIHLSTQANTTSVHAASFWESLGVSRIVLARELSLAELAEIRKGVGAQLEVFVHGAMCISYSGRCLLSNYITGRDANRGDCAQSCRWRYHLVEEKRPGQYFPVLEDNRGTYILSSRDLCLLTFLAQLAGAGIDSFKIEGRVKSVHYVATVVKVYREAIDRLAAGPGQFTVEPRWLEELGKASNRHYTTGFLSGDGMLSGHGDVEGIYSRNCTFVGVARGYDSEKGLVRVEQRNRFFRGETLEVLCPTGPNRELRVEELFDGDGGPIDSAPHPCQTVYIPCPFPPAEYSLLRRCSTI
jgi:putative protease